MTLDPNLKTRFETTIKPALGKTLGITNPMAIPTLKKVIVNVGVRRSDTSEKDIKVIQTELATITGQMPKIGGAKKSIAGFKIRAGDPVGVSVTLRAGKMFDFLDKLCRIVLPQVKDFRGVKNTAFDGSGNFTLGLTEQIIFPEIDYAKVEKVHGLEIVIVTTAKTDKDAYELLKSVGMPFAKKEDK
jgi:large subunit ribosomal protein L5